MNNHNTQSVRIDKDMLKLVRTVTKIRGGTLKFNIEKLLEEGVSYFYHIMLNLKNKKRRIL